MLDGWHEFYILLGTAAAALVALLFVAASIGAGYLSVARGSPTHTYTSPVVFHYTYVLFLSLMSLVPINTDWSLAAIIGVSAAIALGYSLFIFVRVMRGVAVDLDDRLAMEQVRLRPTPLPLPQPYLSSRVRPSVRRFSPVRSFSSCSSISATPGT
jgi:hypothetical protein